MRRALSILALAGACLAVAACQPTPPKATISAKAAMAKAIQKLPIKARIITREEVY